MAISAVALPHCRKVNVPMRYAARGRAGRIARAADQKMRGVSVRFSLCARRATTSLRRRSSWHGPEKHSADRWAASPSRMKPGHRCARRLAVAHNPYLTCVQERLLIGNPIFPHGSTIASMDNFTKFSPRGGLTAARICHTILQLWNGKPDVPLIDNRDDRPMNRPVPEDADSRAPHANDSRQWKLFLLAAILIVSGLTLYVGDTRLHNSAVASAAPSDRMERIQ